MGGICGFFGNGYRQLIDSMISYIKHRGSFGKAVFQKNQVALASNFGRGEYSPEDNRVSKSSNGKIYCTMDGCIFNYSDLKNNLEKHGARFKTDKHSELVANGFMVFGEDVLSKLDGGFGICIYDGENLYIARDALGEKPIYYAHFKKNLFLFSSEIKSFLAYPGFSPSLELGSLHKLLCFSFIPGEETMFKDVFELEPGCFLKVAPNNLSKTKYWDIEENESNIKDESFCSKQTLTLIKSAIRKRIKPDLKIGAFLSGGVDSSSIVALLSEMGYPISTYSIGFGEGQPNELLYAQMVVDHCNIKQHHVLHIQPEMFLNQLPEIIWQLDDPLCDCITIPNYLLSKLATAESDVIFNGEGGDPLFGGPKNKFMILGEWYRYLGGYDRNKAYLNSYHKFYDCLDYLYTPEFMAETGGSETLEEIVRPYFESSKMGNFLNKLMYINTKLKGGQNILVKVDKMVAANGIQVMSPLFDKHLTELAFSIPPLLKRKEDIEKYIFKKSIDKFLPYAVVYRKKSGMGVPLNSWFRNTELKDYANHLIHPKKLADRGYFNPDFIKTLLDGKMPQSYFGRNRHGELLWMLLAIELWHRVYIDNRGEFDKVK